MPSSRPTVAKTSSANCSSSRVCVAVTIVRTRALSRATVGKRDALREHALLEQPIRQPHRERAVAGNDRRDRAFAEPGIEPERLQTGLEERVLSQSRSMICGSSESTSIAAMHAAATAGGCDVENRNGRAR